MQQKLNPVTGKFDLVDLFSSYTTDDLTEGSTNLFFTDERVDDRVSALIQNGTGISWAYNDSLGTLTPTISLSSFTTTDLAEGTNLYYTDAKARAAISESITGIDYNSSTGVFTLTSGYEIPQTNFYLPLTGGTLSGNLAFDTGARTLAGIQNQNLVDKTDSETISGAWTFGASGTGTTVIFNSDLSGVNLTWDHDATSGNPLLSQTLENSRTSYWKISGTDTSPATMSEGILTVTPTFTTGTIGTGANLLFFKPTDSRSISSGTNFVRAIRLEPTRSGTKTSTGADQILGVSCIISDGMTYNVSSATANLRYSFESSIGGLATFSNNTTRNDINFLVNGSTIIFNGGGTNTLNIYGLQFNMTYTEVVTGGSLTTNVYGIFYNPTMSSAADIEYALRANRSGIGLLSDGASSGYTGGNLILGGGEDARIYYDGTDLVIDSNVVGSGTIDFAGQSVSSITTETLSEFVVFQVGGTDKKFAIVA